MSEETDTVVEYKYEDEFSYVSGEGNLMLKETSFFDERKLAELDDEDVKEAVDKYRKAFGELAEKAEKLIGLDEKKPEAIEELEKEIIEANAIGDFETLLNRLREEKNNLQAEKDEQQVKSEADEKNTEVTTADTENKKQERERDTNEKENDPEAVKKEEKKEEDAESLDADSQREESETQSEETGEALEYYRDLVEKAEDLSKQNDWPYVSMELDNLSHEWDEGPEADGKKIEELYGRFQEANETFNKRKEEHYRQLNKQKQENLQKKKNLLEELDEIVSEKKWSAVGQVRKIKGQWKNIGILPSDEPEKIDERFNELIEEFEEHKVDRLVSKRQQEEDNLTGKLIVLDKMEELAQSIDENVSDWKTIEKEFSRLTNQFKRIGKVPPEKADEVWGRYKSAQDEYYDRKYKHDEKHRRKFDKYYQKKEDLCRKAEALLEEEDLASAARELNKLHRRWKKTGNLPQRDEDELWARFKGATDKFNERKSENIDKLREQEETNYQKKLELIERAKEENQTTDWDKGHSIMQNLLDEWKKVGPVPRNKTRKLWKKFKKAQDVFYDRRRDHFQEKKEEQKENLKEKQEILDKLKELGRHDDPIEAVEKAKPLQEKFKNAGYVPIKKKNKIWKQYRKACDIIYDRFRAAKSGNKFDQELAKADIEPEQRARIQDIRKKYKKVKREIRTLEEEVLQYKESKTYFKPSSSEGNPLIDEIQQKIDKAENKLQEKQDKLDELDREIEELRT